MKKSLPILIATLTATTLFAAPPNSKSNVFPLTPSKTGTTILHVDPSLLKAVQPIRLPKLVTPLNFTCLARPTDAPERIVATICRSVAKCTVIPGKDTSPPEVQEELTNICIRDSASEANQLWNNFGRVAENTFTTAQLSEEISAGRTTVNTTAFCNCMNAISSQSCETIEGSINNSTDYANFENLVPETPDCDGVFGP
ncbi:MAG TPA: hypothetical protein VFX30_05685 [bacterium]|nr:hypothetical protein [bacterium]